MIEHRIHYRTMIGPRCGTRTGHSWTNDPEKVTCKTCKRLMSGDLK